jgi:hypothetical protein
MGTAAKSPSPKLAIAASHTRPRLLLPDLGVSVLISSNAVSGESSI